jgi:hypothetical protein
MFVVVADLEVDDCGPKATRYQFLHDALNELWNVQKFGCRSLPIVINTETLEAVSWDGKHWVPVSEDVAREWLL